jgi:L-alanine-DL-glutamate epimerase-like enolase superfamily enzyme
VFRISRGSRTETRVIVVTVKAGEHIGRGECVPIARYNQSCASVIEQIESIKRQKNLNRQSLQKILPAGAARNAVDCALWDLEAKRSGKRVWELAKMAAAAKGHLKSAREHGGMPAPLKLKLYGGDDADLARVKAVRAVAPNGGLIIDANESWSIDHYRNVVPALKDFGVELIEQPFPADRDEVLEALDHAVPVCADESCHTSADVSRLKNRYDILNVKLDKTGGLSEALRLVEAARANGFKLLIGCMVGTSLGMAPARIFATADDYVDLDGPLLLARDRESGLNYRNGKIGMPSRELWG